MQLRPYQSELVEQVRQAWRQGYKSPCIVLPCGGGKSCIVADMARRTTENEKRVLFIVHRKELCEQIERTFRQWGVNMELCRIGMVQTITRRLTKIEPPDLIITDENHHSRAKGYMRIYEAFPDAYKIGVTATPVRLDGKGLKDVNDKLIVGISVEELIKLHCLSPFRFFAPQVIFTDNVKVQSGEYKTDEIVGKFTTQTYEEVLANYHKYAFMKKSICYLPSVSLSQSFASYFTQYGIPAAHIDGTTPKALRSQIIDDFRAGKITILCNVDIISEGFDVPDCECSILLRPTLSLSLYIQQAMRCMRYRKGKTAMILDMCGNVKKHDLPNIPRIWSLDDKPKKTSRSYTCHNCFSFFTKPKIMHLHKCEKVFGKVIVLKENINFEVCPLCGHPDIEGNKPGVEESKDKDKGKDKDIAAELVEIDVTKPFLDDKPFKPFLKSPRDCKSYADLLAYAEAHNYKRGWAYYQARERGFLIDGA